MKKILSWLLIATLVLSMTACVSEEDHNAAVKELEECKAKLSEYESVISLLESGEYDAAIADIESRRPIPPKPDYSEIQITLDNWNEYFELRECFEYSKDDFGEYNKMYPAVVAQLKSEYMERLLPINEDFPSKVTFGYSYEVIHKEMLLDPESGNVEWVKEYGIESGFDFSDEVASASDYTPENQDWIMGYRPDDIDLRFLAPLTQTYNYCMTASESDGLEGVFYPCNLEINRVEGSVFLTDEK